MAGLETTSVKSSSGSLMTNYARIIHTAQRVFSDILQDIFAIKKTTTSNGILPGDDMERIRRTRNGILHKWRICTEISKIEKMLHG